MPKSDSHCAVVGGCFISPAARMCPVENGTTCTAAAVVAAATGAAAALPAPSAATDAMRRAANQGQYPRTAH